MLIFHVLFKRPVPAKGSQFGVSEISADASTSIRIEGSTLVVEREGMFTIYPTSDVAAAFARSKAEEPPPASTPPKVLQPKRR